MVLTDNLVAYYKLDETSGAVIDASGNGHTGINNGATTGVSGVINTAYDFDGSNDYINTTLTKDFNSEFSINFWTYRTDTAPADEFAIGSISEAGANDPFIRMGVYNGNDPVITVRDIDGGISTATNATGISEDVWVMMTATFNETDLILYVDGEEVDRQDVSGITTINISDSFYIGASNSRNVSVSDYYDGKIDEVGVWDRALTETEITQLYNNGQALAFPFNIISRIGDKELKTDWDARSAADSTKRVGYNMALIPQESLIPKRKRVGLD